MKILHLVHQYLPEFTGGTEIYTQQISRRLLGKNHEVAIFCRHSGLGLQMRQEEGVTVWSAGSGEMTPGSRFRATFKQPTLLKYWLNVIDSFQPELVHVQHLMGLPVSLIESLRARGIPYLITFHDYWWRCANAQLYTNYDQTICAGPDRFINCGRCSLVRAGLPDLQLAAPFVAPLLRQRNKLLAKITEQANALIAPTLFVKQTYRSLGIEMPIDIVRHGIDLPELKIVKKAYSEPLDLIYLGSIAPQKGVHIAIEAVNQLPAASVRLTIYGGLASFPDYVAHLKSLATHPGIHFAGRVEREQIWPKLQMADVALIPTLWYEASPLTIDEMFAAGLPIIGSNIGALPNKIQSDVNGKLVPAGDVSAWRDVIAQLVLEPQQLQKWAAGIRQVRSMAQHVAEMEAIYIRVAAT